MHRVTICDIFSVILIDMLMKSDIIFPCEKLIEILVVWVYYTFWLDLLFWAL